MTVMSNIMLGCENFIDTATLFTESVVPTLPVANLKDPHIKRVFRADGSTAYLIADLGSQRTLSGTCLIGTNGTSACTVRVRLSTADSAGLEGDAYDSGVVPAGVDPDYRYLTHVFGGNQTGRYLSLSLSDPSVSNLEGGRWWAGPLWQPQHNYSYGWSRGYADLSKVTKSRGGQSFVDRNNMYQVFDFVLEYLTKAEAHDDLLALSRLAGLHTDVLAIMNPDSSNLSRDTVFGLMTEVPGLSQAYFDVCTTKFKIEERL